MSSVFHTVAKDDKAGALDVRANALRVIVICSMFIPCEIVNV